MSNESHYQIVVAARRGLLLAAAACGVSVAPGALSAQDVGPTSEVPNVLYACYVPTTGTVYRIKETDLREECTSDKHIEFFWNQQGPKGEQGDPGPAGPAGPAGPTGPAGMTTTYYTEAIYGNALGTSLPDRVEIRAEGTTLHTLSLPAGAYIVYAGMQGVHSWFASVPKAFLGCSIVEAARSVETMVGKEGGDWAHVNSVTLITPLVLPGPGTATFRCSSTGSRVKAFGRTYLLAVPVSSVQVQ